MTTSRAAPSAHTKTLFWAEARNERRPRTPTNPSILLKGIRNWMEGPSHPISRKNLNLVKAHQYQ